MSTPRTVLGDMLLLPLPPKSKASTNRLANGKVYKDPDYRRWKQAVALWLKAQRLPLYATERLCLRYRLVVPDERRRDIDNALSGFMDCACGVLFADDSQLWQVTGEKVLDRSLERPQLWFSVTPLDTTTPPTAAERTSRKEQV